MAYDPFLQPNPVVGALEQHRGRVEQTRENTARYAQSFATYTTTGVGETQIAEGHRFGCTFVEQPIIGYGWSLDGDQLVTGALPRCNGGVRAWIKDDRGFFIGAYVVFMVDPPAVLPAGVTMPDYVIDHDFAFTAVALKDLPGYLLDV